MKEYTLVGVDSNAFAILAYTQKAMRECKFSKALQELKELRKENQVLKECIKSIADGIEAVLTDMDAPAKRLEMVLNEVDASETMKSFLLAIIDATTLNTRTELDILKSIVRKFEVKNEISQSKGE